MQMMMKMGVYFVVVNVSTMSSGGFGTTHFQNTTNDNGNHKQSITTLLAITYREC